MSRELSRANAALHCDSITHGEPGERTEPVDAKSHSTPAFSQHTNTSPARVLTPPPSQTTSGIHAADAALAALETFERDLEQAREQMTKEVELIAAMAEKKLAIHRSKAEMMESEICRLQELVESKETSLRQKEAELVDNARKAAESISAVVQLREENYRTSTELAQARAEATNFQSTASRAEEELRECKHQLTALTQELEDTKQQRDALQERADALAAKLDNQTRKQKHREKQVSVEIKEMQHEIENLAEQRSSLQNTITRQSKEIKALQQKIEELQDEEREHEEIVAKLAHSLNSLNKKKKKGVVVVGGRREDDVGELASLMQKADVG
ncbi:hypothetical protein BC832DRAFT_17904 [Gaertneriomyces semiglobifer]|nr:hypothetical protein BC832DRAFT_17904 [Gaertneriomyces semiglobifer]